MVQGGWGRGASEGATRVWGGPRSLEESGQEEPHKEGGGFVYLCQNTKTTLTLGTSPFSLLLSVVGTPSFFR